MLIKVLPCLRLICCRPDPRPKLDNALEDAACFVQAAAGEYQVKHMLPIARPLLDLLKNAPVGIGGIVCFLVGPITHSGMGRFAGRAKKERLRTVTNLT
jgi:hypothetical protein